MANPYFSFKHFTIFHDRCAMKVTTDGCLFGAWCASEMVKNGSPLKVLDIGTGTGLLSLMIAQKVPATIDAIEIDRAAAAQAVENIGRSQFSANLRVTCGDIREVKPGGYDAVVCNPPFYQGDLQAPSLQKNIAHHSSGLRWDELFPIIANQLQGLGSFYLLLPFRREREAEEALAKAGLFIHGSVIVKPSETHQPFRLMLRGSKSPGAKQVSELHIKDAKDQYTSQFVALLKDYYLAL